MAQLKVLTLDNLDVIKNYIDVNDAKSLKTATIEGNVLKIYNVSEPVGDTEPVYELTLPQTDVSNLLAKLTGAVEGNVVIANADGTVKDGGVKLADLATKEEVSDVSDIANANKTAVEKLNGDESTDGSVKKQIKDAVDVVEGKIGTLANLNTTAKTDLVNAINEVRSAVEVGGTGSVVTIDSSVAEEGMVKSYVFKQGETTIGTVNVPLDLVVSGGEIVVDPDGQPVGTYLKLTIANQTSPVYINVADLVDAYTAQANGTQIQLAISDTNEISATIVAKSIGTNELADASINTAKIADANVTAAKLADDAKALFDTKGSATQSLTDAKAYTDEQLANIVAISEDEINALFSV